MNALHQLVDTVQRNCHVSDAQYAGNYTMCVFLLKMREYYRWENRYPLGASLPHRAVADWLHDREQLWDELRTEPFAELRVDDQSLDPFDSEGANRLLVPRGLVYSGGYGRFAKPLFFLGELVTEEHVNGFTVLTTDDEYARDLSAPVAMTQGDTIYLRRSSLRQTLWEAYEEWRWKQGDNPIGRALKEFGFDDDPAQGLERMTNEVLGLVRAHELGEGLAGRLLGPEWEEMLLTVAASPAELLARAVRDHLADALSTLPYLREADHAGLWHYYRGNLSGARQTLFPRFAQAYDAWLASADPQDLDEPAVAGRSHWERMARRLLSIYREHGAACQASLNALTERELVLA